MEEQEKELKFTIIDEEQEKEENKKIAIEMICLEQIEKVKQKAEEAKQEAEQVEQKFWAAYDTDYENEKLFSERYSDGFAKYVNDTWGQKPISISERAKIEERLKWTKVEGDDLCELLKRRQKALEKVRFW